MIKRLKVLKNTTSGFTLVELLTVMAIIAILAAASLFGLNGARESARDTKRKSDLEAVRSALELYKADCGVYPPNGILVFGSNFIGPGSCGTNTYMSNVPQDPISGRQYSYNRTAVSTYNLCASLEGGSGAVAGCGPCGSTCNYKVTNP
ncbi:MAG: LspG (Type II protein secretion LspG pseudopilin) [Candidatus Woesebacteria bacterium GW2011_GWA1_39_8]|jgi:general secretion pathway protein G|uniref:LspG (Type II protein secretion LspG pseudopilin) n=1 Tax=Candidatus Woesebacteria bacterium GW2011_GWA1_39_8 TaxID=1618552 RepID=A0A0G0SSU7_9BACT|nr:MAG: LspG (Type II protein secretion LspG pseudopilin) [Candidatus Woesebacteria bacterium GW2011_GWA1_39_8]